LSTSGLYFASQTPPTDGGDNVGSGGGSTPTGTVWDYITPTQECYDGTHIPRSFELKVGNNKFWVHGNATQHMKEYIEQSKQTTFSEKIRTQMLLKSFHSSVEKAIQEWGKLEAGRYFGQFDTWELGINTETGVIYHALIR